MQKENIKQIVQELFRENYRLYPESYPVASDRQLKLEGAMAAEDVAKGYWKERTELDIERDEQAGVTEQDYISWVHAELESLIN